MILIFFLFLKETSYKKGALSFPKAEKVMLCLSYLGVYLPSNSGRLGRTWEGRYLLGAKSGEIVETDMSGTISRNR